jgi:hypothetical protein
MKSKGAQIIQPEATWGNKQTLLQTVEVERLVPKPLT